MKRKTKKIVVNGRVEYIEPITASGFCDGCPDREGCMMGYPCSMVKRLDGQASA